jgi:hypothetical protein
MIAFHSNLVRAKRLVADVMMVIRPVLVPAVMATAVTSWRQLQGLHNIRDKVFVLAVFTAVRVPTCPAMHLEAKKKSPLLLVYVHVLRQQG